ncbi:MAG: hypothetical protein RR965_07685, partial [Enterococcus sp.]
PNLTGLKATIESASKGVGYFKSSKTGWDSKEVEIITKMLNGDATPEETVKIGGYTYKGGRIVMETFSDQLIEILNEKKQTLSRSTKQPLSYFKVQ